MTWHELVGTLNVWVSINTPMNQFKSIRLTLVPNKFKSMSKPRRDFKFIHTSEVCRNASMVPPIWTWEWDNSCGFLFPHMFWWILLQSLYFISLLDQTSWITPFLWLSLFFYFLYYISFMERNSFTTLSFWRTEEMCPSITHKTSGSLG
jgi:hypothetical protein